MFVLLAMGERLSLGARSDAAERRCSSSEGRLYDLGPGEARGNFGNE
jgi:hypothetical protein